MKETPTQKLKRELLELRQQLFEGCTNPNSVKSQTIIMQQKFLKAQGEVIMQGSYCDKLKQMGFGRPNENPFTHYESKTVRNA